MAKKQSARKILENHMRRDKYVFAVYIFLRTIVIFSLIRAIFRAEYESVFICGLTLVLMMMPALTERRLKIDLPTVLEIIILVFIFSAEILGELNEYYVKFNNWDTILHTTNGFLCAAVGFALVDILNRSERSKIQLSPLYLSLVAFCFSMTIGVLWEFFEFAADVLLKTDMQKDTVINAISSVSLNPTGANKPVSITGITDVMINGEALGLGGYLDIGLYDTMEDMFVNFIGAVVFSIIGYIYTKNRGEGKFASSFIPVVVDSFDDAPEMTKPVIKTKKKKYKKK